MLEPSCELEGVLIPESNWGSKQTAVHMRWSAGHCEGLTREDWGRMGQVGVSLVLQRSSFWMNVCILGCGSEDRGKMLGKELDCSPGSDMFSRITPGHLGGSRIQQRERERESGVLDSSKSPGHDLSAKQASVVQGDV